MAKKSNKSEEPEVETEAPDTFEYNGKKYKLNPTLEELLKDAALAANQISRYAKKLNEAGLDSIESLALVTKKELKEAKLSGPVARQLFNHIQRVKRQGGMIRDFERLKEREAEFLYLPTGSTSLDEMLAYADGSMGLRTKTMIELFGEASMGKSQICMTTAAMALRDVADGGFGRGVAYIDSEGAFQGSRFEYLCEYWGVPRENIEGRLFYSRVQNFDEVELALQELIDRQVELNLGLIVVDSIIDPLKNQYLVGGEHLNNLQPRQQHLQQVLSMLKGLAESSNAVALYTNHVRSEIGTYGADTGAQGGHVMAHASDIRIKLSKAPNSDCKKWYKYNKHYDLGLKAGRAQIVDSGFVGNNTGYFLVGPMGIADPNQIKRIEKQCEQIKKSGYLSVNAKGDTIERIDAEGKSREERLAETSKLLYGEVPS